MEKKKLTRKKEKNCQGKKYGIKLENSIEMQIIDKF